MSAPVGVSFVIPIHNGDRWLDTVIASILAQADRRPMEIIAVEDGSRDRSVEILSEYARQGALRVVEGPRRGATAALNAGLEQAQHPIICQVDQDVVLSPGWMVTLVDALVDPTVAAAQGYYETPRDGTPWSRAMGLDLEYRYHRLLHDEVDHVCTGNTAYRADALRAVGLFDERLGYGYDNDISYRLVAAGYRLVIRPQARSVHRWRDGWRSYLVQQYGFGYGRLDLVAKHRHRVTGDDVSRLSMMLHAPLMAASLLLAFTATTLALLGMPARAPAVAAVVLVIGLASERFVAGTKAALLFRDSACLWFVPVHLVRDVAWAAAILVWCVRRVRGSGSHPSHSMRPRPVVPGAAERTP